MKMTEFSIIIPVYNVENYLETCIKSIVSQTYDNFELILVNDGSTDNSGIICEQYKETDKRLKIIHKENGGLSSARNKGLDVATGLYVIFVDSDDFWEDITALFNFHKNLSQTNADLLLFPAKRYYEKSNKFTYIFKTGVERVKITNSDTNSAIKYMIENNIYRAAAWNKVIKKTIIDNNNMRFREGCLSEDMDWCGDLLLYCHKFDYYDKPLYIYRQQRCGSITLGKPDKLVHDKLYMCKKGYIQAIKLQDKKKANLLLAYYAYEYSVLLGISGRIKNKALLADMKKMEILLDSDISYKVKHVNKLKKIIGYSLTRIALCFFVMIKK